MAYDPEKGIDLANESEYYKKILANETGAYNEGQQKWANEQYNSLIGTGYGPGEWIGDNDNNPLTGGDDDDDDNDGGGKSKSGSSAKSYINKIYNNLYTAQERQLKRALEEALEDLEIDYKRQQSDTYAGQMVANLNSNEAMLNQGINSGAVAQAALSSNNALQGNLGQLSQNEAYTRGQLQKDYQANLASLRASLEAQRLNALLEDYYN